MQDPAGGSKGSRAAAMINRLGGATLTVQVRDEAALSRSIDGLVKLVNFALANARGRRPEVAGAASSARKQGARPKYVLDLPQGLLPPPFSTMFRPTIILGPEQLVLGASTAAAERAAGLSAAKADGRWRPDGAYDPVMRRLPGKMVGLRISDPRETLPAVVEALPVLAQMINAQIAAQRRQFPGVPAVTAAEDRARQPAAGRRADPPAVPRVDGAGGGRSGGQPDLPRADPGPGLAGRRRAVRRAGHAREDGVERGGAPRPSAPTTSSRSPWRITTSTRPTTPSPRRRSPTRTASRC